MGYDRLLQVGPLQTLYKITKAKDAKLRNVTG